MWCSVCSLQQPAWISSKAACILSPVPLNDFSCNTRFQHCCWIWLEESSCTKIQFFKLSYDETLIPGMQPMKLLRQLKGSAPAAACKRFKTTENSLLLSKHTVIIKGHASSHSSFLWLLRIQAARITWMIQALDHPSQGLILLFFSMHRLFCHLLV